jgi:hypothetical protein
MASNCSASMDGVDMPEGGGVGHTTRRRENGLRLEWHFAPAGPSTHTFVLSYVVAGVAQKMDGADLIGWIALPREHNYRIEASEIDIRLPAVPAGEPVVDVQHVGQYDLDGSGRRVTVQASDIGKNGWINLRLRFADGAIIVEPPLWQQRGLEQRKYVTPSLIAAGVVLFAGFVLLFGLRQSYDSPPKDIQSPHTFSGPPDSLAPALAGTLIANGRPRVEHAMSTLFSLADRGVVAIREEPHRRLGLARFTISRSGSPHLAPHEQALLDSMFKGSTDERVELNKARAQLMRTGFRPFRGAVLSELQDAGMLDSGRRRVQSRYFVLAAAFTVAAVVTVMLAILVVERVGPAPMLVSVAIGIVAFASVLYGFAHTPLSNQGVRRAESWRAFRKHLRARPQELALVELLPFAVAFGLAGAWAKLLKTRGLPLPAWFQAASHDPNKGFAAFVAYSGAGHSSAHSHGGAVGASAGGGASGAS